MRIEPTKVTHPKANIEEKINEPFACDNIRLVNVGMEYFVAEANGGASVGVRLG